MPDLVKVLSASSIMEGEIVKARLEGEGIPVLLKGGGSDPYGMGVAYVFVPSEFEAQARLVLEDVSDETLRLNPARSAASRPDQRLEYCGALRAFLRPYLRRSFSRASRER